MNSLIIGLRFLVGFAFIPSGLVKLMGEKFTTLSPSTPIGYFFDALYHSGIYWNFLGFCQLLIALLFFTQRFATVGALLFFAVISNIFFITIGLSFTNTWIITLLMMFAGIILLIWDWYLIKPLFGFEMKEEESKKYKSPSPKLQLIGLIAFIVIIALLYIGKTMTT